MSNRRLCLLALSFVACKANRGKLEELVPDGATGIMSIDAQAILKSELYAKTKTFLDAQPEAKASIDALKNDCGLDVETAQSYVSGFDVAGQNFLLAIRMPNLGKKSALECALGKMPEDDDVKITITEVDGRAALDLGDGIGKGWAWDDDTLVVASKGWTEAVQQRMKGEGKAAVDHYLKDAVALADRDRHIWFAGEVPALAAPFLDETPAKGLLRVAGGIDVASDFDIVAVAGFADEPTAKTAKDTVQGLVDGGKAMAIEQGVPKTAVDSLVFEQDGSVVRMKVKVPIAELVDSSTSAFTKYMQRSKTSEARVQIAKMFDSASAYFNEEHVGRGSVTAVAHACPNDGRDEGSAAITPPLSVDCSKGCDPSSYGMQLWTDNAVWQGLNFQLEQRHYFHYDFKWKNTPGGYGSCQFTAQAFGDLDGDGVYSTFERSGSADELGVNAVAGLHTDQELE